MDELKAYRGQIFLGYTIAGVATSLISLFVTMGDVLEEIPVPKALVFLAVMIIPMCIGNIIARDISSLDDSWSPFAHLQALKDEAPIILTTLAFVVTLDVVIYFAKLPSLFMMLPPIVGGFFLNGRLPDP